jgi:hypothetical protein
MENQNVETEGRIGIRIVGIPCLIGPYGNLVLHLQREVPYRGFMRRLAERPANVLFLARNFFSG